MANSTDDYYDDDYSDWYELFESERTCKSYWSLKQTWITKIGISTILYIIFTYVERKRGACCLKNCCCKNHCGSIVPVKFLEDKHNRLAVMATFSLIAKDIYVILFVMKVNMGKQPYQKVFGRVALVQLFSILYIPLLVASTTKSLCVQVTGSIYSVFILICEILATFPWCPEDNPFTTAVHFVIDIISCFVLIMNLVYKTYVLHFRKKTCHPDAPTGVKQYHWEHVYRLLNSPPLSEVVKENPKGKEKLKKLFKECIYWNIPGFRYSITVLISTYVGILTVVLITVSYFSSTLEKYLEIDSYIDAIAQFVNVDSKSSATPAAMFLAKLIFNKSPQRLKRIMDIKISWYDLIRESFRLWFVGFMISVAVAFCFTFLTVLHLLKHYRKSVIDMSRNIQNKHLFKIENASNVSIVVSALQFGGFQVAHLIWGFHLQLAVLFLAIIAFGQLICIPLHFAFDDFAIILLEYFGPIILIVVLTIIIQYTLVKFFFVQERGKLMGLDNRRGFYNTMYFFFFYNIFSGVLTCLIRILKSIFFSICFIPRLDRSVFPRSFEKFDSGFKGYACLLKLEAMQSNSILVTFIGMMANNENYNTKTAIVAPRQKSWNKVENIKQFILAGKPRSKQQTMARNRWFLTWTLMHNPDLIPVRKIRPKWLAAS